jgi:hypothetical protein
MHGDLTRSTFDPSDHFSAVRAQQGRVMLDADHNEQVDIQLHDTRQGRVDLLGGSGAPADDPGFGLSVQGLPVLGAGRYLVDGIRIQNSEARKLELPQPFLPDSTLPNTAGAWLAYLEVWERSLSAVEEPSIREVALGGPDTTLRDQVVWQVRWLRIGDPGAGTCSSAAQALDDLHAGFNGTLEPRLQATSASGPCVVSEAADFRGLENQLYRVEIHRGNVLPDGSLSGQPATFKWSRDNGAIVATAVGLASQSPIVLQVERLGPGGAAGFELGGTIEIRNEARTLSGQPGILARVEDVQADALEITLLSGTVSELNTLLGGARVVVRRWDSIDALDTGSDFQALEDGLEVRFQANRRYRAGDFWLIPARTAALPGTTQQLDWPLVPAGTAFQARTAQGIARHHAPLALLDRAASGTWSPRSDCRKLFPPLTAIWSLTACGGEGQHGRSNEWLPAPISVLLTRGSLPMANATLRFRIASGGGALSVAQPSAPTPVTQVDLTTDDTGRAQVYWRLGAGPGTRPYGSTWEPSLAQTLEVVRIGGANAPVGPVARFVAQTSDHFNLHIAGGNGQQGRPGETLEIALRVRVDDGERPIENAVVEFAILNTVDNGQALNEDTGGSVHASARFVSGQVWNGGTRYQVVRTTTDNLGVAQVQWMLGTELTLPTQRVEARLLDRDGKVTAQSVLFLAQLAIAQEISWQPKVPWLAEQLKGDKRNVQDVIDTLAGLVDQLSRTNTTYQPFLGIGWRSTGGDAVYPFPAGFSIDWPYLAALTFREDLVPSERKTNVTYPHGGVRVFAELWDSAKKQRHLVLIPGNLNRVPAVAQPPTPARWEWTLSSEGRGILNTDASSGIPMHVQVVPRWLPGGIDGDSTAVHEFMFVLRLPGPIGPRG